MPKYYLPNFLHNETCAVSYKGRPALPSHRQSIVLLTLFHCVGPPFPSELPGKLKDTFGHLSCG